jgi:putative transposase
VRNAFVESFNSSLRDEYLNEHLFMSLAEARRIIETWRLDHTWCRPHSSPAQLTPREFAEQSGRLCEFGGFAARPLVPSPGRGQNINRLYL